MVNWMPWFWGILVISLSPKGRKWDKYSSWKIVCYIISITFVRQTRKHISYVQEGFSPGFCACKCFPNLVCLYGSPLVNKIVFSATLWEQASLWTCSAHWYSFMFCLTNSTAANFLHGLWFSTLVASVLRFLRCSSLPLGELPGSTRWPLKHWD